MLNLAGPETAAKTAGGAVHVCVSLKWRKQFDFLIPKMEAVSISEQLREIVQKTVRLDC